MNDAMWIRESTRNRSPLTIDRGVVGLRFPMLAAATGRVYLAFCPADEREQILRNLARSVVEGDPSIPRRSELDAMLETIREQGYGERYREPPTESGAIAVPILQGEQVAGCLAMTFIASALSPQEAANKHLATLQEAAQQIAEGVRQSDDLDPDAPSAA